MRIPILTTATLSILLSGTAQTQIIVPRDRTAILRAPIGPIITALSDSSGAPRHPLSIIGSGFGEKAWNNLSAQQVHFVMNGQDVLAEINNWWSDTTINVFVPTIPNTLSGRAEIYVVAASGARSTSYPYSYIGPFITSAIGGTAGEHLQVNGGGFGQQSREVHFVVNGQDAVQQGVDFWNDNQLSVVVPTFASVIVPTRGEIYVVNSAGVRTASQPFQYSPVYGTRVYCMESSPPGTTIWKPGSIEGTSSWPSGVADPGCVPKGAARHYVPMLQARAGNDWFFMGTRLTNGWVVDNVILGVYNPQMAGAVIASFNKGSPDVATNIRWWVDVGAVGVTYTLAVVIRGPVALPDGLIVR